MILRVTLLLILAAASSGCATSPTIATKRLWTGIYTVTDSRIQMNGESPTGDIRLSETRQLVEETTVIPAKLDTSFGVAWKFNDVPESSYVNFTAVWRFPAPGLLNPITQKVATTYASGESCNTSSTYCATGWNFGEPWELVPGSWVLEIRVGEALAFRQEFLVVAQPP